MFKFVLKRSLNYFMVVFLIFSIFGCELLEDRNSKINDVCEKFRNATMEPDTPTSERLSLLDEVLESDFIYNMEGAGGEFVFAESKEAFMQMVSSPSYSPAESSYVVESTGPYNITMNTDSSDSEKATVNLIFNFDITIDMGEPMALTYLYTTKLYLKNKNSVMAASNWKIYKWTISDITIGGGGIMSSTSSTAYIPYRFIIIKEVLDNK